MKTILFDLDGTLLPMDQDIFVKTYFGFLSKRMSVHGYDPKALIDAVWKGTGAMIGNDNSQMNETVFWAAFSDIFDQPLFTDIEKFDEFYREDFGKVREVCGYTPHAAELINYLKSRGIRIALATNPIFPKIATDQRIEWAGLNKNDFSLCTTYENIGTCKPNPEYYREIVKRLGGDPSDYLMIGNDVREDGVAKSVGINVFILTDCIINKDETDISDMPHGSWSELREYIDSWLA